MLEITRYFSVQLQNPAAVVRLAVDLIDAAEDVPTIPYANSIYQPIRPLKYECRKIKVRNYLMFYWVDEEEKFVIVARMVYAKRNYDRLLK